MGNKVINLRSFTLEELKNYFMTDEDKYSSDVFIKKVDHNVSDTEELSISEHLTMEVYKGSENLYVDILMWKNNCTDVGIQLHTKDAHDKLNQFINEIIKQS